MNLIDIFPLILALPLVLKRAHIQRFIKLNQELGLFIFPILSLYFWIKPLFLGFNLVDCLMGAVFFVSAVTAACLYLVRNKSEKKIKKRIHNLAYQGGEVTKVENTLLFSVYYYSKLALLACLFVTTFNQKSAFAVFPLLFLLGAMFSLALVAFWGTKTFVINSQKLEDNSAKQALIDYQPKLVFYFSAANHNFLYHLYMWLPYLKQVDNIFIMVRESVYVAKLKKQVDVPVVVCNKMADIETYIPESVHMVFYANNGTKNTHAVRFNHLTHVQLLHGDSEKPPSYSPVSKMYDYLFVSGQRAIDRYEENNVQILPNAFVNVGRPQTDAIARSEFGAAQPKEEICVLIAPTWVGFYGDSQFSSLFYVASFIEKLLQRNEKFKVIFRPHPLTNFTDPKHKAHLNRIKALLNNPKLAGSIYNSKSDIVEDFNQSDVLLTDTSSVPIDYLVSGKPVMHIDVNGLTTMFEQDPRFTVYKDGVYVFEQNLHNFNSVMEDVLYQDSKAQIRKTITEYYHGDVHTLATTRFIKAINELPLKDGSTLADHA